MLNAQSLQQPLESVPMSRKGYVLLKDGEVIEGKIISTSSTRGVTQVTLRDENDNKRKFRADEISEFMVAMNDFVRLQYLSERGSSVKKLFSRDQPKVIPEDFIVYRNVTLKPGKEQLLQLLNPDFDEVFEVFYDPSARKSTSIEGEHITWTGDKHRVFLVRKNGGELVKIKKNKYKNVFYTLFVDCQKVAILPEPKFDNLDDHILMYQEQCLNKAL